MNSWICSITILAVAAGFSACGQGPVRSIAESHIDANIPSDADFDRILRRDSSAYFVLRIGAVRDVEYELLRHGPTQSGAVRIAAIDRTHFEITDFLSSEEIQRNSEGISNTFPAALVPVILKHAAASQ
jgi:hypothetical protein